MNCSRPKQKGWVNSIKITFFTARNRTRSVNPFDCCSLAFACATCATHLILFHSSFICQSPAPRPPAPLLYILFYFVFCILCTFPTRSWQPFAGPSAPQDTGCRAGEDRAARAGSKAGHVVGSRTRPQARSTRATPEPHWAKRVSLCRQGKITRVGSTDAVFSTHLLSSYIWPQLHLV